MKIKPREKILFASVLLNIIYYVFVFYTWQKYIIIKPGERSARLIDEQDIWLAVILLSAVIIFLIFQLVDFVYKKYKGIPPSRHFMYSFVLNLLTVAITILLFLIIFL